MAVTRTEAWLEGPLKTQFYTLTYFPRDSRPKAVIVYIHAFADHVGRHTHFFPLISCRGIAIFAFDQRGSGLTALDTKKRSKGSAYGKTTWKDQMKDIAWAIRHVKALFNGVPIFLSGHALGGVAVLGFATKSTKSHQTSMPPLHGVIAMSPIIQQTRPVSKLQRWLGSKVSLLIPYVPIAIPVKAEDMSRDEEMNKKLINDDFIKLSSSLKSLIDMLAHGDALLATDHKNWPKLLPLLIFHGTADKIGSCEASKEFLAKVSASDKKISLFEDCFHALMHEPGGVQEKLADELVEFIEKRISPSTGATEVCLVSMGSIIKEGAPARLEATNR